MSQPTLKELHPHPNTRSVDAATFVDRLDLRSRLLPERPLVFANMVSSLDGNATFSGRSAPLSDAGDRSLFHALRGVADAVLAGTGTLAVEHYGPAGDAPVVTISRSGELPTDIPLFQASEGRVIAFCGRPPDLTGVSAQVSLEPLADTPAMLETLRHRYGIELLLCEGGPQLLGALLRERLVDEVFLTLSPRAAGGAAGPSVTAGPPAPELIAFSLTSVLERDGTLYLRYRARADPV